MEPLVVGIDFDGTICDTASLKLEYIAERFNMIVPIWQANRTDLRERHNISDSEYDLMVSNICSAEKTMKAKQVPGAIEAVKKLSKDHRIYIVTGRYGFLLESAHQWITAHGLADCIEGYVSSELCSIDKLDLCADGGIDVMVDDDPGQFVKKIDETWGILLRQDYPKAGGIFCAKLACTWKEALRLINT